tara:strand:- start:341 stop:1408 length:1068 start_codon:yes stop_codon:yes gene_type:complete
LKTRLSIIIPNISYGGAERVVSILANYLDNLNFEVSIILLDDRIDFTLNSNIKIITPSFKVERNLICLFKIIGYYRKTIKEINPNIIFSFLEFYNEIVMLSLSFIKKNIYLFDRNTPYLKEQNFAQKFLKKIFYPRANGIIVQTMTAKKNIIIKKLNQNILVLPNPISVIKHKWTSNNNKTIICVGSLEKQKNQKYLIDVFESINDKEWKLVFLGAGSLLLELKRHVKNLKMKDNIFFLGSRSDIQKQLSESTIFAFPSLWEGFPNALLEALCVGVPSISNNCNTGPSELIDDNKNGFLVEINNFSIFKKKLKLLMYDENLRRKFSENNTDKDKNYSVEQISNSLITFILKKTKN